MNIKNAIETILYSLPFVMIGYLLGFIPYIIFPNDIQKRLLVSVILIFILLLNLYRVVYQYKKKYESLHTEN